jgi:hypothetical protein|nr:MAG TPA: KTSC domain [Caudoviricetes sp.]
MNHDKNTTKERIIKYIFTIIFVILVIASIIALKEVIDNEFIESRAPATWTGKTYDVESDGEYYSMYEVVPPQYFELVAYNKKTEMLAIKTYDETEEHIYYDVPESVFEKFINDKSPLEFYNKYLKNTFESDY